MKGTWKNCFEKLKISSCIMMPGEDSNNGHLEALLQEGVDLNFILSRELLSMPLMMNQVYMKKK